MTLTISISPDAETLLRKQAAEHGADVVQYARHLIEQGVGALNGGSVAANAKDRLAALNGFVERARAQVDRFPPGYVADDSRDSNYEGRGE